VSIVTSARLILISLRPRQWIKNSLVFAGIIFSQQLTNLPLLGKTLLTFVIFCLLSGSLYLINDLFDREQDLLHPRKRKRPIPTKQLSPDLAGAFAISLTVGMTSVAFLLSPTLGLIALVYTFLNLMYSLYLKRIIILDVLTVSLGFILRALAGTVVIGVEISSWLLICTALLALFLSLSKRRQELTLLENNASAHRTILKEYTPYLLDQMLAMVTSAILVAYALYTISLETVLRFQTRNLTYTLLFVIYGIFRYLYLIHQKNLGGNPEEILFTDKPLLINVLLWLGSIIIIIYLL